MDEPPRLRDWPNEMPPAACAATAAAESIRMVSLMTGFESPPRYGTPCQNLKWTGVEWQGGVVPWMGGSAMRGRLSAIGALSLMFLLSGSGSCSLLGSGSLVVVASAEELVAVPGEPVPITVTVSNVGDARAEWGQGSSTCQLALLVRVNGEDYLAPLIQAVCTMDLAPHGLGPGESRTEVLGWDGLIQREPGRDSIERLGPGTYEVRGAAGLVARSEPVMITLEPAP